ncbi:MAG: hypothetical protein OHK0017_09600 [Patescibacteria group bacterium]
MSPISNLLLSFLAWPKGLIYVCRQRWTWPYLMMAILVNIILFVALLISSYYAASWLSFQISQNLSNLVEWQLILLNFLVWPTVFFIAILLFGSFSSVVNAPIYGSLTNKLVEIHFNSSETESLSPIQGITIALGFEIKKILIGLVFLALTFSLNFIPFFGSFIFLFINILQLVILTGLDMFEPYHTLRKLSFRFRMLDILSQPSKYWIFLIIAGFISSLPVLNIVLIPISIVAGILLQVEKHTSNNHSADL